ncbi:MAG: MEDS domain-containing protein [Mycobacteriaceae bacterium]
MDLKPGDHVCAMYMGTRQRDEFLLPFLRSGLIAGDKCLCVVDSPNPGETVEALRGGLTGIDIEDALAAGQLEVTGSIGTYLASGAFVKQDVFDFWERYVGQVFATGRYQFARAAGEMPERLRRLPGGIEAFMDYEAELNLFTQRYPQQVLICMYDLDLFGGGIIVDLLRTHSRLLLGGLVLDNPHCPPPPRRAATEPPPPSPKI